MKRLLGLLMILVTGMVLMSSCTDAKFAKIGGYGDEFTVQMYSGGVLVREWTSSGKVKSEEGSDGYYFMDKNTDQLVEVAGDVVITSKLSRTSDSQYSTQDHFSKQHSIAAIGDIELTDKGAYIIQDVYNYPNNVDIGYTGSTIYTNKSNSTVRAVLN